MNSQKLRQAFSSFDWENPPEYPPHYPPPAMWEAGFKGRDAARAWKRSVALPGALVLYVHVPFCREVCAFCGFSPVPLGAASRADRYLDLLEREAELAGRLFRGREFMWICFGGGTPSLLSEPQLRRLFSLLKKNLAFSPGARVAFESHPDSLDAAKVRLLAELGVDWLSIGVQTFDARVLALNGRRQDTGRVPALLKAARRAGIANVQLDLLAGLPGQTEKGFLEDVRRAAALKPERIYLFPFQRRRGVRAGGGEVPWLWDAYRRGVAGLEKKGYDISCGRWLYRRGGRGWPYSYDQGEKIGGKYYSVLGLGPGAISYARFGARYRNERGLEGYARLLARGELPVSCGSALSARDEMINFVTLNLIQRGELRAAEFAEAFGRAPEKAFPGRLEALAASGVLARSGGNWLLADRERGLFPLREAFYPAARVNRAAARLERSGALREALGPAAAPAPVKPAPAEIAIPSGPFSAQAARLLAGLARLGLLTPGGGAAGARAAVKGNRGLRLVLTASAGLGETVRRLASGFGAKDFVVSFPVSGALRGFPAVLKELGSAAALPGIKLSAANLPPCLLPPGVAFEPCGGSGDAGVNRGEGLVKPRTCSVCPAQLYCPGLPAGYPPAVYAGLRPVPSPARRG